MKSSLQGDFSRFPADRRYSGVQTQQGRVQLDADWNAQGEIVAGRAEAAAADLIGPAGGPHGNAGFALIPRMALAFDGRDDFVNVPHPPVPAAGSAFTFEATVGPRSGGGGGTLLSRVAESREGERDACQLGVDAQGRLSFLQSGEVAPLAAPNPLPAGRFSRVAAVCDGTTTTLYVDGQTVASRPQGHPLAVFPSLFLIGAALLGRKPYQSFDGLIRDVRWWGTARTAAELAGAADRLPPAGAEGLLAWWPCDETGGPVVRDHSGHGHDGQLGAGNPAGQPERLLYDLRVGAGRYYVGGVLCELAEEVPFTAQPDYPGATLPRTPGWYLAYLDVWERFVTAVQDPALREVALGGATTTTRTHTLAQVKLRPLTDEAEMRIDGAALLPPPRSPGSLRARRRSSPTLLGNLLYRVEIHSSGWPRGGSHPREAAVPVLAADAAACQVTVARCADDAGPWQAGDRLELFNPAPDGTAPAPGQLLLITGIGPRPGVATLSAFPAGVSADGLWARRVATFVWSRDNGSVILPVAQLQGAVAMLQPAEGGQLPLRNGDWVALENDPTVLQGVVPTLLQVRSVDRESFEVTLAPPPPAGFDASPAAHPLLRLWNQSGDALSDGAVPASADGWTDLEAGVQVCFAEDGPCRAGDYWWIPARTYTEDIEWPRDASGPLPLPPAGPEHLRAPLALVHLPTGEVQDRRRIFQPRVDGAVSKAGDTMYGPLEIRANLGVEGEARAEVLFGRLGTPGVVGTPELADGAVTTEKIALEVGLVPPGCSLLGDSPRAPAGYVWTGASLPFSEADPEWRHHAPIPREHAGAVVLVLAAGRAFALLESGEVWELDPAGGTAPAYRTRLPSSRRAFAAAAAGGRIHVLGGVDPSGNAVATHEDYDPAADRWTRRADLLLARDSLAAATVDGTLYAVGGRRGSVAGERVTGALEEYDPGGDSWRRRRPMPTPRCALAAAVLAGRIHALAGERRRLFRLATLTVHEEYQPATDRWLRHRSPLLYPRRRLGAAAVQGALFAVGGEGPLGGAFDVQRFDPATGAWTESVPLAAPAVSPGVAGADGTLFVVGGGKASRPGQVPVLSLTLGRVFYVYRRSG
jgi:hypothetical protein